MIVEYPVIDTASTCTQNYSKKNEDGKGARGKTQNAMRIRESRGVYAFPGTPFSRKRIERERGGGEREEKGEGVREREKREGRRERANASA